jgi:hypothetical protein
LTHCPLGLVYRSMCIRTLKSIWDKQSTKNYVIESIKRSSGNLKPIVVIDDATKKAECFIANAGLTGFESYTDMLLCRKIETIAEYAIIKHHIQKSNKSKTEKEKFTMINEKRNYKHQQLETKDEKAFNKFVKELD